MKEILFTLLVIVPIIALRLTADRRARDWFASSQSSDPRIAAAQRRSVRAALGPVGHRRFRNNLPYALVIGLIALIIGVLIDHFA